MLRLSFEEVALGAVGLGRWGGRAAATPAEGRHPCYGGHGEAPLQRADVPFSVCLMSEALSPVYRGPTNRAPAHDGHQPGATG